jgi:hypothetical protein
MKTDRGDKLKFKSFIEDCADPKSQRSFFFDPRIRSSHFNKSFRIGDHNAISVRIKA